VSNLLANTKNISSDLKTKLATEAFEEEPSKVKHDDVEVSEHDSLENKLHHAQAGENRILEEKQRVSALIAALIGCVKKLLDQLGVCHHMLGAACCKTSVSSWAGWHNLTR